MLLERLVRFLSLRDQFLQAAMTLCFALTITSSASAEDTVVTGKLLSNEPMEYVKDECPENTICMGSWWKSIINVNKTIHGPPLAGRIAAGVMQHTWLNPDFKKRVSLFVLKPIESAEERSKLRVDYYLEEMSSPSQMFCFSRDPKETGLAVQDVYVAEIGASKEYCFELPTT